MQAGERVTFVTVLPTKPIAGFHRIDDQTVAGGQVFDFEDLGDNDYHVDILIDNSSDRAKRFYSGGSFADAAGNNNAAVDGTDTIIGGDGDCDPRRSFKTPPMVGGGIYRRRSTQQQFCELRYVNVPTADDLFFYRTGCGI